jgi:integrase
MDLNDHPVTTRNSRSELSEKQLVDYEGFREPFVRWLATFGKDPDRATGFAHETVKRTAYRTDQFNRWVWNKEDGYTTDIRQKHADEYMKELAYGDYSSTHKANSQKALKRFFKWKVNERGGKEWDPDLSFSSDDGTSNPRDFLTREERQMIREAALEYGAIPRYDNLNPSERSRWKAHLAQRFEKPKTEITSDDWEKANGWKFTSLTWASLDAGLRPVEVGRATTNWVDLENRVLRIPKEESSKNKENWVVSLTDRTAKALERWLEERKLYEKYEDTDALWLTRKGNTFDSNSLSYVLDKLCGIAGISQADRSITWYSIRHSVGTYMTREEGLAAAQAQLRHKSEKTTMKYDQAPVEDRRSALDNMG